MGTPGYPAAQPAYDPNPPAGSIATPAPGGRSTEVGQFALTAEETAEADLLYDELKPAATASARDYVLARTPAAMQEYMVTKIEADWPLPPADDPSVMVRVQGEQGRVSIQKPAISDKSPQVEHAGKKLDPIRTQLDTGRDANLRRANP